MSPFFRFLPLLVLAALIFLSGCHPKNPGAVAVVRQNLEAMCSGDLEGLQQTIHPQSPSYPKMAALLAESQAFDLECELEQCDVISSTPTEVSVAYRQVTRSKTAKDPAFRDNRVSGVHFLRLDGDQWKIWGTRIKGVEYLDD